jgi:glyoxylase-like metal-dependent hydrolase (beta-lactamase superfamily II)
LHTPGHTPGHTAFYRPESRLLIAGDALGSERRGHLRLPKRVYAEDWGAALRSVRRLADLQPEIICFGHGRELHQASDLMQKLAGSLPSEEI